MNSLNIMLTFSHENPWEFEYLVGVRFLEVSPYLLPLCNEDTGPVTPALIISGCDKKSYADKRRKPLEFQVRDRVLLKVSPWKGVVRFGKRGKLNPRYVGPFEIIERIGKVAYRLNLPEELSGVHNVFHVSNLKKCLSDETLIVPLKELTIDDQLRFVEEPVEITDQDVKILKHTRIPLVRVRWNSRRGLEYTWEREDQMKLKYPQLFKKNATTTETEATAEFRDEIPNQWGDDVTPQENQENNAT
uniref:Tf2-1-like SH3-like domain-containing protein n=1 Tax=Helianthus annuus TaxID=4232 RepID=A0A251STT9_HELAN